MQKTELTLYPLNEFIDGSDLVGVDVSIFQNRNRALSRCLSCDSGFGSCTTAIPGWLRLR